MLLMLSFSLCVCVVFCDIFVLVLKKTYNDEDIAKFSFLTCRQYKRMIIKDKMKTRSQQECTSFYFILVNEIYRAVSDIRN